MMPPTYLVSCLLAATLALGGCQTIANEKKAKALENSLAIYREAMRWGYFDTANGYVHPDQRKELPAYLENVQVAGYDEVGSAVMKGEEDAEQVVHIEYVLRDRQQLRSISDRQHWRYDAKTHNWWLMSGLPEF